MQYMTCLSPYTNIGSQHRGGLIVRSFAWMWVGLLRALQSEFTAVWWMKWAKVKQNKKKLQMYAASLCIGNKGAGHVHTFPFLFLCAESAASTAFCADNEKQVCFIMTNGKSWHYQQTVLRYTAHKPPQHRHCAPIRRLLPVFVLLLL